MFPIHSMRHVDGALTAAAVLLLSAALGASPAGAQTVCRDEGVEYLLGGAATSGPGCKRAGAPPARRTLRTAAPGTASTHTRSPSPRLPERADFGQDERRLILETVTRPKLG